MGDGDRWFLVQASVSRVQQLHCLCIVGLRALWYLRGKGYIFLYRRFGLCHRVLSFDIYLSCTSIAFFDMDVSEERIISSHTGGSDCVLASSHGVGLRSTGPNALPHHVARRRTYFAQ